MSALPAAADVEIEPWTGPQLAQRINEAMAIYVVAMNYPTYAGAQRSVTAQGHTNYAGFACRAALRADGRLVGFAYGYTSTAGQWWHDLVRRAVELIAAEEQQARPVLHQFIDHGERLRIARPNLRGSHVAEDDHVVLLLLKLEQVGLTDAGGLALAEPNAVQVDPLFLG